MPINQSPESESSLSEVFNAISADGFIHYTDDCEKAFLWYEEKGFPQHDRKTRIGADTLNTLAGRADNESLWKEAWAGSHLALDGYSHMSMVEKEPFILRRLGRAHTGLSSYKLASLYLEAAQKTAASLPDSDKEKPDLITLVLLENAVCTALSEDTDAYSKVMDRVSLILFPGGSPSAEARKFAMHMFQEGNKNSNWHRNDKPIRECLYHALGFYHVSADLNIRLNELGDLGITLINMGYIAKDLGQLSKAKDYWEASIKPLEHVGDSQNAAKAKECLRSMPTPLANQSELESEQCPDCDDVTIPGKKGNGICSECDGSGSELPTITEIMRWTRTKCRKCAGSGKCQTCKGTGHVKPGHCQQHNNDTATLRDSAQDEKSAQALEALFKAIADKSGAITKVEALLSANSDLLTLRNKAGTTALHAAAGTGCLDVVRLLISKGADVNARTRDGGTPLHYAASHGYSTAIIEILLSSGADINARSSSGKTPLGNVPSWLEQSDVANLLKRHGGTK